MRQSAGTVTSLRRSAGVWLKFNETYTSVNSSSVTPGGGRTRARRRAVSCEMGRLPDWADSRRCPPPFALSSRRRNAVPLRVDVCVCFFLLQDLL